MTNQASYISIPIPTKTFIRIVDFLREEGSARDPVAAIDIAVEYWLENASRKQETLLPEVFDQEKGYQWKQLFLPHGTMLRMKYRGEFQYSKVDGDRVIYKDQSVTPSIFANLVAGSSRNAWRDLEIRCPDDNAWHIAEVLRQKIASLDELLFPNKPPVNDEIFEVISDNAHVKYIVTINNEKVSADTLSDVLEKFFNFMYLINPDSLEKLADKLKKKRPYLAKNREDVYPGNPDLLDSHPPRWLKGGYWMDSNIGIKDTERTMIAASEAANLEYGKDITFTCPQKVPKLSLEDLFN